MMIRVIGLASVFACAMVLGACIPEPGSPTTTTTTTTTTTLPPGAPAAGCYDSFVDTVDMTYSGVPDVEGNLTMHTTGDGTCQGLMPETFNYTLVYSPGDQDHADEFCSANDMEDPQALDARGENYDYRLNGETIGPDAYLCVKRL